MRILADENIPALTHFFANHTLVTKPGRSIVREDLLNTDILLVRSVTQINEALLHGTPVRFVGSATVGEDHMDTAWLDAHEIAWSSAKGSNAEAVMEYVICVIAALQKEGFLQQTGLRAGVIGAGDIGNRVITALQALGFEVITHDPFRTHEKNFLSMPLAAFSRLDLVSIHVPLTTRGNFPTWHLLSEKFFAQQKQDTVIINTSRGAVLDSQAWLNHGSSLIGCFDVWENEPHVEKKMIESAKMATPHIAGYSVQAKLRSVEMLYHAMIEKKIIPDENIPALHYPEKNLFLSENQDNWRDRALAVFDPHELTRQMKQGENFDEMRRKFNERYEFAYLKMCHFKGGPGH